MFRANSSASVAAVDVTRTRAGPEKVVARFPEAFNVIGLTAYNNYRLLEKQIKEFFPRYVAVNEEGCSYLKNNGIGRTVKILNVHTDLEEVASLKIADIVVIAMQGSAALKPFLAAVRSGKTVAPANKEAIVIAGDILMEEARRGKARIVPIDSEQSAIFQCLEGRDTGALQKVYLTASGGTLLDVPRSRFNKMSVRQILNHPRWKMGRRITVDSATLMNKGFEVIEAKWLFGIEDENIEVLIHPQSIIHSLVEFIDGSVIAQLGIPDMRIPISYALNYPDRLKNTLPSLNLAEVKNLSFEKPDTEKFPCLKFAFDALKKGETMPAVLNAANEIAVNAFLNREISFNKIPEIIKKTMKSHKVCHAKGISDILKADRWAREHAKNLIASSNEQ